MSNAELTVIEKSLQELRDSVVNSNAAEDERIGSPSLGDVVRQGDLYLVAIEKVEGGKPTKDRQLVEGTSQGSRHILSGDVEIFNEVSFKSINSVLMGPAFTCKGEVTVEHPEHGNKILPEDTSWQCVGQQAYAEEVRRVVD